MQPAIEIRSLGKQYTLAGLKRYISLRDVINESFKNFTSSNKKKAEKFWALQDINLDIMPGERVGIIGRNGAGKSTLLKIISRITPPTTGEAIIRGRVGSLLEVGTGFHPELTGRENIYLNGSILGLKKNEIDKQLDTIIDFSGVEKFIDTPLKHYSSGMEMRLAFSVSAHLRSEILLIDEVLAVGDIEFQKKCLGKMEEVSKEEGKTILFVSHNLKAVSDTCQKALLLDNGREVMQGPVETAIGEYIRMLDSGIAARPVNTGQGNPVFISALRSFDSRMENKHVFNYKDKIGLGITIQNNSWGQGFSVGLGINRIMRGRILRSQKYCPGIPSGSSREFIVWLTDELFTPGQFTINTSVLDDRNQVIDSLADALSFEISAANTSFEGGEFDFGVISQELKWEEKGVD